MEKITHKVDKKGNVVIEATGDTFSYEAILIPKVENGMTCIPKSSIDTCGIDNSTIVRDEIIETIQRIKDVDGENPLVVDNNI